MTKAIDQNTLYLAQDHFLELLKKVDFQSMPIMLCGGTALARVYLHHRVSYDLDFFIDAKFNPDKLAFQLGKQGMQISDIQIETGGALVHQLSAYVLVDNIRLQVSFIEDNYAGMFASTQQKIGSAEFNIESVEGLYHRKLRTISGSGNSDRPVDGRQSARDLFDLWVLDQMIQPINGFILSINRQGANFPQKAFITGLLAMPWLDMMDEFDQLDINPDNPYCKEIATGNRMHIVRTRMHQVIQALAQHG